MSNPTLYKKNLLKDRTTWIILLIVILCLLCRLVPGPRIIDDSYITYRYVRNIINGIGFSYNPGEHVLGTTTPFYTFLLTLVSFLFNRNHLNNLPVDALAINAIADSLTCIVLWRMGKHLGSERVGLITAALWSIAPFSVTFAIGGLETSVYVFWLVFTCFMYLKKEYLLGAIGAAFALLTRPDALILLGPIFFLRFVDIILKKASLNWREIVAFTIPIGSWIIFSTLYFGSPLPHSVQAKLLTYQLGPLEGTIRLLQHYATPFLDSNWGGSIAIGIGLFLYPFLFVIGSLKAIREDWHSIQIFAYPVLYFCVFAIANPLIFRWYLTPPLPLYFLGIILGGEKIILDLTKKVKWKWVEPVLVGVVIFTYPFLSTLSEWVWKPDHGTSTTAPEMSFVRLELLYQKVSGMILKDNDYTKSCVVAAGDVGVLGFFTEARILDTVGLNSPQSLMYYPLPENDYVINYAIPAKLILNEKPDYFVLLDVYGRNTILQNPDFQLQYSLLKSIPTDIYGSESMLLYKRNDIKCGVK